MPNKIKSNKKEYVPIHLVSPLSFDLVILYFELPDIGFEIVTEMKDSSHQMLGK